MKKLIFLLLSILLFLSISYVSYTYLKIKKVASIEPPKDIAHLIVLGAKVNGDQLSKALLYRAETALSYWKNNQSTKIIVTGGQGNGEDTTEASALMKFFIQNGVPKESILVEDKSTNTYENLQFTKELYSIQESVIVSNDFHLYRAVELAKELKITAFPLAARTPKSVKLLLYLREYAAILKMHLTI
ncbi:YdcF family protein [Niallia sp.]|uniref:YdcF family protein n=1 Tax=Niallia sp. TaxID=2837523 RepID=UPI00289E6AF9|nr:YdcF family protein [Niallia sp.]